MNRTIIALTGRAGAGKTTAAEILMSAHGARRVKFAGGLKAMFGALLDYAGVPPEKIGDYIEGSLKEQHTNYLMSNTPRRAMQTLGHEWGRLQMGTDFWIHIAKMRIASTPGDLIVVDDCRYLNEAQAIRELGGKVIRIVRPGDPLDRTGHASEDPLPDSAVDVTIVNSSDIRRLHDSVSSAFYNIRG